MIDEELYKEHVNEDVAFNPIGSNRETVFLEGPHSRWQELKFLFHVLGQFIYGFRKLHFLGPCVTVFGSARFKETHPYYGKAREIGAEVVKLGFTIMTGGGPGIMEAANRGAKEAHGRSIGCNIILPHEQKPNGYLDRWVDIDYFFIRKVLLTKYSYAFVVMPGGYGTLDEFFEETGECLPVMISGTVTDASGRILSGQTVEAFWNSLRHIQPLTFGLNCALGAALMRPYIAELAKICNTAVSCYPNAGLPNPMSDTGFDETPDITSSLVDGFAKDGLVNLVGGCCGTTPEHIRAIAQAVSKRKPRAFYREAVEVDE